jgi:hypothetical protein
MVLFNSRDYRATELPWYYAPWWFLIATRPVVLAGAVLSALFSSMDSWGNCVLQAVNWSAKMARSRGTVVAITGFPTHLVTLNAERFQERPSGLPYAGHRRNPQ